MKSSGNMQKAVIGRSHSSRSTRTISAKGLSSNSLQKVYLLRLRHQFGYVCRREPFQ